MAPADGAQGPGRELAAAGPEEDDDCHTCVPAVAGPEEGDDCHICVPAVAGPEEDDDCHVCAPAAAAPEADEEDSQDCELAAAGPEEDEEDCQDCELTTAVPEGRHDCRLTAAVPEDCQDCELADAEPEEEGGLQDPDSREYAAVTVGTESWLGELEEEAEPVVVIEDDPALWAAHVEGEAAQSAEDTQTDSFVVVLPEAPPSDQSGSESDDGEYEDYEDDDSSDESYEEGSSVSSDDEQRVPEGEWREDKEASIVESGVVYHVGDWAEVIPDEDYQSAVNEEVPIAQEANAKWICRIEAILMRGECSWYKARWMWHPAQTLASFSNESSHFHRSEYFLGAPDDPSTFTCCDQATLRNKCRVRYFEEQDTEDFRSFVAQPDSYFYQLLYNSAEYTPVLVYVRSLTSCSAGVQVKWAVEIDEDAAESYL
eukprot:m51a1_g6718 hypothetical protein (428) ;mRNA; r:155391-157065